MSDTETDIRELLPFWVNGTLEGDDLARVKAAVAASGDLRAEAEALRALRARIKARPQDQSPGEMGLARLMRAIDRDSATNGAAAGLGQRGDLRAVSGLLAASAAIAAVLASALTLALTRPAEPVYEQASANDPGAVLTVTFHPEATEAAISALLLEKGLVIVDGPSALGLYRLALPYDTSPDEAAVYLAAATAVISTVEMSE